MFKPLDKINHCYCPHLFLFEFTHRGTHVNTHTHAFAPHAHKRTLPPHLVHQTVFNTNHWPVDVSALLRGISSVQTLSLNSLSHTQTAKTNTINYSRLLFWLMCFFFLLFLFCCFYSILWQPNSQEAQWVRYEAWWLEVCVCLCNLDGQV